MELRWFDGWTEPLPVHQFSEMQITPMVKGVLRREEFDTWRVDHVINDFGSHVVIVQYWDDVKIEWHEVWHEHVLGMTWQALWSSISSIITVCRDSMLP